MCQTKTKYETNLDVVGQYCSLARKSRRIGARWNDMDYLEIDVVDAIYTGGITKGD